MDWGACIFNKKKDEKEELGESIRSKGFCYFAKVYRLWIHFMTYQCFFILYKF